jgi:uncharacterized protein
MRGSPPSRLPLDQAKQLRERTSSSSRPVAAPHRVLPVIRQRWRDVSFLHWPIDSQVLQSALPPRLAAETHDGSAWLSIVCFSTTCVVAGAVPLPGPRTFPETNVRTYVRGPDGRDGLYFFSLDVTNRANVMLGRASGLRYRLSDMEIEISDRWSYQGTRRDDPAAAYSISVEPQPGDAASSLDIFLTARWSGYAQLGGHLVRYDVQHHRWPLRPAVAVESQQLLLPAEGLPQPTGEPLAHVSTGVDVNLAPHGYMW